MTQIDETDPYRGATAGFNIGSHVLYLNSLMLSALFVHDLLAGHIGLPMKQNPSGRSLVLFFVLAVAFMIIGLAYGRLADYREIAFLTSRTEKYARIVACLDRNWGSTWGHDCVPWRRLTRR